MRPNSLPVQHRFMALQKSAVNVEERTISLVASTEETIVDRWWGREQLVHAPAAILMDRAQSEAGIAALWGHDIYSLDSLLGRVESFELDVKAKVTRAIVRLATTEEAEKALTLIRDGALRDVSIGYRIHEITILNAGKPDELQRVSRWEPVEVSFVSVPADPKAGIGRSMGVEYPVRVMDTTQPPAARPASLEVRMDPENGAAPQAPKPTETPAPPAPPEVRALITPEVRSFLADAEKLFGSQGRTAAEEILGQAPDLGRAGAELLKRFASKPLPPPAPSLQDLGASERELQGYSYRRALAALVDQAEGRQVKRGFEHEISDTLARLMPVNFESRGGILLPLQVRALVTGTAGSGKDLVFPEKGELIELLRNVTVALKMGARFLGGLSAPITFPKITGGATASWTAEDPGADVADSQLSTGTVTLTPKTLQASTPISRQLLYTSSEDAEAMIRQDLAQAHGLAWDKAVLHGSGAANQPTGIYAAAGVNVVAMGGNPTHGKLVDMVTEIAKDNAILGTIGYVTTPSVAGKLMQTLVAQASGSAMIWTGTVEDGRINGYRAMASNQVLSNLGAGTNEHGMICANWAQVLIGQFGPGFELILDPYAKKKQGLVEFTSFEMVDAVLRHSEAFCKSTGLVLS